MDCSQLVLSVIKDDSIKKNLNPIVLTIVSSLCMIQNFRIVLEYFVDA